MTDSYSSIAKMCLAIAGMFLGVLFVAYFLGDVFLYDVSMIMFLWLLGGAGFFIVMDKVVNRKVAG